MFNYSNAFTYSANPETGEFMISFMQQQPIIADDGKVNGFRSEPVAQVFLTRAGIDSLKKLLDEIKTGS